MTLVSFPSAAVELLAGPLTAMGTTDYDLLQLDQATTWKTTDPLSTQASFYDRALNYYLVYYRTGDSQWLTTANAAATAWADDTITNYVDMDGYSSQPARDYATLGMAIHYLLTGYANSLAAVRAQAKGGVRYFHPYGGSVANPTDSRESAYALMAMVATTLLGGDPINYSSDMTTAVNAYMTLQGQDQTSGHVQPNDSWQNYGPGLVAGDGFYIENWMSGLVAEALILYERLIGDTRIVPALKRWIDWLWSTQWVPLGGGPTAPYQTSSSSVSIGAGSKTFTTASGLGWSAGDVILAYEMSATSLGNMYCTVTSYSGTTLVLSPFAIIGSGTSSTWRLYPSSYPIYQTASGLGCVQYANIWSGSVGKMADRSNVSLMGMMLQSFGYLRMRGQGSTYQTNGGTMLTSVSDLTAADLTLPKQWLQTFRASPKYLGYLESPVGTMTAPRYTAAFGAIT